MKGIGLCCDLPDEQTLGVLWNVEADTLGQRQK